MGQLVAGILQRRDSSWILGIDALLMLQLKKCSGGVARNLRGKLHDDLVRMHHILAQTQEIDHAGTGN